MPVFETRINVFIQANIAEIWCEGVVFLDEIEGNVDKTVFEKAEKYLREWGFVSKAHGLWFDEKSKKVRIFDEYGKFYLSPSMDEWIEKRGNSYVLFDDENPNGEEISENEASDLIEAEISFNHHHYLDNKGDP